MRRVATIALVALLVVGSVAPVAAVGGGSSASSTADRAQTEAYAGSHVSFEASGNAVTNYSVDGTQVFASAETQSQSDYEAQLGVGSSVSLSAVTNLTGVALSLDASTETQATVQTESGASIRAHDSQQGILTVDAGSEAQYTSFELSGDASASAEGENRVVVENGDRTSAFVVAGGDGEVTVNEEGNVVADLESEATLVVRSYEGERSEDEREQERLIAEGTATAQVYVEEQSGSRVADVATYGGDLAVDVQSEAEGQVSMTVDRASSEGTVVIASVSEGAIATAESADDVNVTVDGQAAVQASSYSELQAGIGNEPRYMVRQTGEASASADVLVAVDHFSERTVAMESSDGGGSGSSGDSDGSGSGDDGGSDDGGTGSGMPGFGPIAALLGLLSAIGLRLHG